MLLRLDGIGKTFGGLSALDNVSFGVAEGEVIGLIGPNGAGKTTLFNVITAVFSPTSGRVIFLGEDLRGLSTHAITIKGITRTFQNIRLFQGMTSLENVMVGRHCRTGAGVVRSVLRAASQRAEESAIREKARDLLSLVGLPGREGALAGSLPYGHQRRLEIARALACEPRLILLDEPVAGMNERETGEIFDLILKIRELGVTILLIEHDMSLVMKACDRIVVLNFGSKIAEGIPSAVQEDPAVIEAYLGREDDEEGFLAKRPGR